MDKHPVVKDLATQDYIYTFGNWCTDVVFIATKILLDGISCMHGSSGLPHDTSSICLVI